MGAPNCQLWTSMLTYRSCVRRARALRGSGERTSAAVPSQVSPASESNGPYAIRSLRSGGGSRSTPGPAPKPSTRYRSPPSGRGEVPHRASKAVVPSPQQNVAVHPGLIVGLVEGKRPRGGRAGKPDNVHAARSRFAVVGEGRAPSDHLRRVSVHVGPMQLLQLFPECRRAGPVTVVAQEVHGARSTARGHDSADSLIGRPGKGAGLRYIPRGIRRCCGAGRRVPHRSSAVRSCQFTPGRTPRGRCRGRHRSSSGHARRGLPQQSRRCGS